MAYTKHTWQDGEEGGTPIDAQTLNEVEDGIANADSAIGQARAAADNATAVANAAAEDAADAEATASAASATADAANATATAADTKADQALSAVASAQLNASNAVATANLAQTTAESAATTATAAASTAAGAVATATAAASDAADAATAADHAETVAAQAMSYATGHIQRQALYLLNGAVPGNQNLGGELIHREETDELFEPEGGLCLRVKERGIYAFHINLAPGSSQGSGKHGGWLALKNQSGNLIFGNRDIPTTETLSTLAIACVYLDPATVPVVRVEYHPLYMTTTTTVEVTIVRLG